MVASGNGCNGCNDRNGRKRKEEEAPDSCSPATLMHLNTPIVTRMAIVAWIDAGSGVVCSAHANEESRTYYAGGMLENLSIYRKCEYPFSKKDDEALVIWQVEKREKKKCTSCCVDSRERGERKKNNGMSKR